jgi:hypothetical protein
MIGREQSHWQFQSSRFRRQPLGLRNARSPFLKKKFSGAGEDSVVGASASA